MGGRAVQVLRAHKLKCPVVTVIVLRFNDIKARQQRDVIILWQISRFLFFSSPINAL